MHKINEIVSSLTNSAKEELSNNKELTPKIVLLLNEPGSGLEIAILECTSFFKSPELKSKLPHVVSTVWKSIKEERPNLILECVVAISDTWQSERSFKDRNVIPSKDPDRREALAVIVNFENRTEVTTIFYNRVNNGIIYEEPITLHKAAGGIMTDLYPKDLFSSSKN